MRILGIDPGLTRLGVGIIDRVAQKDLRFLSVEVLRSDVSAGLNQRLHSIGKSLEHIFDSAKPDVVSLERVFAQQNVSTVIGTAQISGIAIYLASERNIPVRLYTPSEVKAAVTGFGSADKKQVTAMVTRILKLDSPPTPADAADALALAITHAWRAGHSDRTANDNKSLTPAQVAWLAAERGRK